MEDIEIPDEEPQESPLLLADESRFPTQFPPALVEKLRSLSLPEIGAIDSDVVVRGMNMFFANRFRDAEELFAARYREDCLVASAYATMGTVRALLSVEQGDIDEACKRLLFASRFATAIAPSENLTAKTISAISSTVSSALGKASGFLSGGWRALGKPSSPAGDSAASPTSTATPASPPPTPTTIVSPAELRARVVHAEAEVLRATLLLLQDSLSAYLKAGLALRRSYNTYADLEKRLNAVDTALLDANSLAGVRFGLGCIHVVTSILPAKVLAVLKALGYMHSRSIGFDHLNACIESNTLRSPLATLFLIAFHGLLPSFAVVMVPSSTAIAEAIFQGTQHRHPDSVIHLWLAGRARRLTRDTAGSVAMLNRCIQFGAKMRSDLIQLQHFALYDQAWNYCAVLDWSAAAEAFATLEKESNWSKKMFSYSQACCYEMLALAAELREKGLSALASQIAEGHSASASESSVESGPASQFYWELADKAYRRSNDYPSTRLGGKVISVDQFNSARLAAMFANASNMSNSADYARNTTPLCGFELMLAYNVFTQAPASSLDKIAGVVRAILMAMLPPDSAVLALILGLTDTTQLTTAVDNGVECAATLREMTKHWGSSTTLVLLQILADCLRDRAQCAMQQQYDERADFVTPERIYDYLLSSDVVKTKCDEIKWIAPFACYSRAILRYWKREAECHNAAVTTLKDDIAAFRSQFGRVDYHFEMQMQFRLHLTEDFVRTQSSTA